MRKEVVEEVRCCRKRPEGEIGAGGGGGRVLRMGRGEVEERNGQADMFLKHASAITRPYLCVGGGGGGSGGSYSDCGG
ncbi:hypothetical protein M0802_004735 [Mischocyttarus mexicanus]|nr:hypothetical protein M0802_004735 [Mischocyttarus mexicanus]